MDAADGLSKDWRDIKHFQLRAQTTMLLLRDRVGHNDLVNGGGIDAGNGISTEDAVGDEGVNSSGTLSLQQLGSASDCVGRIGKIVDQDTDPIGNVANKHHAGVAVVCKLDGTTFLEGVKNESRTRRSWSHITL